MPYIKKHDLEILMRPHLRKLREKQRKIANLRREINSRVLDQKFDRDDIRATSAWIKYIRSDENPVKFRNKENMEEYIQVLINSMERISRTVNTRARAINRMEEELKKLTQEVAEMHQFNGRILSLEK